MKPARASFPREDEARAAIVETGRRLYAKDLIAAGDGNISVRTGVDRVLVTRSGVHKGFLTPADVIAVDLAGRMQTRSAGKPSSEFLMHALCYAERPECRAVVHAHPPTTVALALAGVDLTACVLSEACLVLGAVPTAPYSTPTTEEVPRVLRDYVKRFDAVVMDRHGALCLGRSLDEAWRRMETLEHTARTVHAARMLGPVPPMADTDLRKLGDVARSFGLAPPAAPAAADAAPACCDDDVERIVDAVVAKVRGTS